MTIIDEKLRISVVPVLLKQVQHFQLLNVFICPVCIILYIACNFKHDSQQMNVKVEFDIFSGRPNPTWTMDAEESKELINLLEALPVKDKNENNAGLGYRGFNLIISPEKANEPSYNVYIFNGTITKDSGTTRRYHDMRGLEKWLLRQASDRGFGAIADSLRIN